MYSASKFNRANQRLIDAESRWNIRLFASNTWSGTDSFQYCGNGATTGTRLRCGDIRRGAAGQCGWHYLQFPRPPFNSNVATTLSIKPPGVLAYCKDASGYPLTVDLSPTQPRSGWWKREHG